MTGWNVTIKKAYYFVPLPWNPSEVHNTLYIFSLKLSCSLEDDSLGLQYKMMMTTHDKCKQVLLRRNSKYLCYNSNYLCSNRDGILCISILMRKQLGAVTWGTCWLDGTSVSLIHYESFSHVWLATSVSCNFGYLYLKARFEPV